jgi:hypothetical protein
LATSILDLSPDQSAASAADAEDLRLAEGLRAGTEMAYEELIQRFQQPVYALAIRLLNDPAGSSDVVQEVFLKVFRNIGNFRGQSTLPTTRGAGSCATAGAKWTWIPGRKIVEAGRMFWPIRAGLRLK